MKIICWYFVFCIVGCTSSSPEKEFLSNQATYKKLYKVVVNYDFMTIAKKSINTQPKIKALHKTFIQKALSDLEIRKIEQTEAGIFFITGYTFLGNDGFFRSQAPKKALTTYTTLTPIVTDWYYWYQD